MLRALTLRPHTSRLLFSRSGSTDIKPKMTIFSGIQPTGDIHLGNYLGAIHNWIKLQKLYPNQTIFSIVDLHSLTTPDGRENLRQNTLEMATVLLACGIDPKKSIFFTQSRVSCHAELTWLLSCITPMNLLNTMIQYKEKTKKTGEAHLGLLSYPVLMAADILLYKATHVPVGEDQQQHLQLASDLAKKANREWKTDLFVVPEILLTNTSRVMSLGDASKKMSKSDRSQNSRILLCDDESIISDKIKRSKTDSINGIYFDEKERPEVANLLKIFSALSSRTIEDICQEMKDENMLNFKLKLTDLLISELRPVQKNIKLLKEDKEYVEKILDEGGKRAEMIALDTLNDIKKNAGLF